MVNILLSISVFLTVVSKAHAVENFADYDTTVFKQTRTLCSSVKMFNKDIFSFEDIEVLKRTATGFSEGFINGLQPWKNEAYKISTETSTLIRSDGFKAAMYDCFGADNFSRDTFITALVVDDILGHVVGLGVWFYPISKLTKALRESKWALANPRFVGTASKIITVANRTGLVALVGYMGWNEYSLYQLKNNTGEEYNNFTNGILKSSRVQVEDTYNILEELLAATNQEIAKGTSDKNRMEHLLREKQILEERLKQRSR